MAMIYWLNIFSLPFEYYLIGKLHLKKSHRNLIFLSIVFLQWWLIASLRNVTVGWDTPTYENYFYDINKFNWLYCISVLRLEPLYISLNSLVGAFSLEYRVFLCVVAAIIYGFILVRMNRYSKILWLSCWLFVAFGFYNFSINILRQSIALAVVIFSLRYIVERKIWKFIFCILIATLFHYTAIVFIVTYLLYKVPANLKSFILLFIISFIITVLLLPKIMGFIISSNEYYNQHIDNNSSNGYGMMAMLLATTIGALFLTSKKDIGGYGHLWIIMMIIATCTQLFAFKISILVRVVYYWQISMIFLFPYIISKLTNSTNKTIVYTAIILVSLLYYAKYAINIGDVNGTVPYSFLSF